MPEFLSIAPYTGPMPSIVWISISVSMDFLESLTGTRTALKITWERFLLGFEDGAGWGIMSGALVTGKNGVGMIVVGVIVIAGGIWVASVEISGSSRGGAARCGASGIGGRGGGLLMKQTAP